MADFDELFRGELDSQGFGFQHAVVQAIHRHRVNGWIAAATEFPVAYRGRATHIDVLAWCLDRKGLLVGECKRVNPAFGSWVFARSPFTFDGRGSETWLEQLLPTDQQVITARTIARALPVQPYHIAFEVKTDRDGDPQGQPKGRALAQSLTQVEEGVNGLIQMLPTQRALLRATGPILFVSAVFTTANLYAADNADLHMSDLQTGHMPASAQFEKRDWLWFEHNTSPDLLHEVDRQQIHTVQQFSDLLPIKHTRATAIVSPDGVSSFLRAAPGLVHQVLHS